MIHGESIIFLFVDGIGLGVPSADNPFHTLDLPGFRRLSGGHSWIRTGEMSPSLKAIDATLGVDGFPQSGTGQATLFTGVNCAKLAGRHYGPYPHSATRQSLREENVFRKASRFGEPVFANAYPDRFFTMAERRDRWTVTTRCCLDAGIRIRTTKDLAHGEAVAADLTGKGLSSLVGDTVMPIDETIAAERLLALAQQSPLVVFEYYLTDKAGHAQSVARAEQVLDSYDRFLLALLSGIEDSGCTLVLTSDHGNLEDLSVKTHTRNPVPLAVHGPRAEAFDGVTDLAGVTPAIIRAIAGSCS